MSDATRTERPLTTDQTDALRGILEMQGANGGSTQLARAPESLVRRGLVVRVRAGHKTGTGGHRARWALTPAGMEIAVAAQAARDEQVRIRQANRGSNAMIGA